VSDADLVASFGLEDVAVPGHSGVAGASGVVLMQRTEMALASVIARRGGEDYLARKVRERYGLDLPARPQRAFRVPHVFVWAGPGQWLAVAERRAGHEFESELRETLAPLASIADQSDARAVVRVSGPRARDALAKGVPIDLDPRAFRADDAALTVVSHIGVQLWRSDEVLDHDGIDSHKLEHDEAYEFAMFRSFANSFWRWLLNAGAEYGVTVTKPRSR
jgi:sarcosine oxidase subunit gamma